MDIMNAMKDEKPRDSLVEAQLLYQTIFEQSPDGILLIDTAGAILEFNEAAYRQLGYSRDEFAKLRLSDIDATQSPEEIQSVIRKQMEDGYAEFDAIHLTKNGVQRDTHIISKNLNLSGRLLFHTIWQDITDRREAEKKLQRQMLFEELINRLLAGMVSATASDIDEHINVSLREIGSFMEVDYVYLLLASPEDSSWILTKKWLAPGAPDYSQLHQHIPMGKYPWAENKLLAGEVLQVNTLADLPDEAALEHEALASQKVKSFIELPLHDRGALISGVIGLRAYSRLTAWPEEDIRMLKILSDAFVNALERRRVEKALRESESQLRQIIDSLPHAIFIKDWNGNFLIANKATAQLYDTTVKELMGKSHALFHKDQNELRQMLQDDRQVMTSGETKFIPEETFIDAQDNKLILQTTKIPFYTLNGPARAVLGIAVDITEHKRLETEHLQMEARLKRAEKMEALGTLAGGVAHDLNNVLGVLTGYSELLLEQILPGRLRTYVEKILASSEKGASIIQDLLTLTRRAVTAADVLDLNQTISTFLESPVFEKLRDRHPNVVFRAELGNNLLNIKGSSLHLEKTVMNLIANAAESIIGMGEVTIRTENRYLDKPIQGYDTVAEGDYVILTVSDTGEGIAKDEIDKIFEPFYTKKVMGRSGTGLGLTVVWGTVKDHNGYLDVQSEEGKGSTFSLYFPITREKVAKESPQISVEKYMGHGESVLVVDDVAEQRDMATGLLSRLCYDVHTVNSGEEAIEYVKRHKTAILVLDMIMEPGIDGLETYRRICEINPHQKAILVSGFSETDRVKRAQELGAGEYVKKPYLLEKIGLAIRNELAKVSSS